MSIAITDVADHRLDDYRSLTDTALRRRIEPARGMFIAEGELVVRRAVAAGYAVRSMLVLDRYAALAALAGGAPVYLGTLEVLQALTGYAVHRGVLAAMERRAEPTVAAVLETGQRLLVLEDMNNPTNVGAVFRCAAALGMDGVLLSPRCADPLYRRAVRVSMGAVFAVPYARLHPWPEGLRIVTEAGYSLVALTPDDDAPSLDRWRSGDRQRVALLLGAEGPGLTRAALDAASARVRIPMARGVDSLNVAAAAAVACFVVGARR